jgi:aspartyl/asparaginyl beta-hydroxylase (cupin superfamily)
MKAGDALKARLLWSYLRMRALARGMNPDKLGRVHGFILNKFGQGPDRRSNWFPGLSARPVHDTAEIPWVAAVESAAASIRREYEALSASGRLRPHPQNLADAGEWNTYYLYSNGVRFDEHCQTCPVTSGVVSNLPGGVLAGQAYFSVMAPGTHVAPHHGPTNTRIRCHLGLKTPASSRIRVDTQELRWTEGRCIVFDDSFEHEVFNPDGERAVLIMDAWHPELTPAERWALTALAGVSRRNRRYRRAAISKSRASGKPVENFA